jgi:hypothetical protein
MNSQWEHAISELRHHTIRRLVVKNESFTHIALIVCAQTFQLNAFVVPAVSLHVAQVQKAQAKAPCALVLGQPFQPIGDLLVLFAQYWAVAIASVTDLLSGSGLLANHERMEGTTGKCDTGAPLHDCIHSHLSSTRRP